MPPPLSAIAISMNAIFWYNLISGNQDRSHLVQFEFPWEVGESIDDKAVSGSVLLEYIARYI